MHHSLPLTSQHNAWATFGVRSNPLMHLHTEYHCYHQPPTWFQALKQLRDFTQHQQLLCIIDGTKGSGKTSLLLQWLRFGHIKHDTLHIQAKNNQDANELIHHIAKGYGINLFAKQPISKKLNSVLTRIAEQKKPRLLIIDQAELLSITTLSLLSESLQIQTQKQRKSFKLILLINSNQMTSLRHLMLDSLPNHKQTLIHLPAFSLSDSKRYLKHVLQHYGLNTHWHFNDKQIAEIHTESEGNPGALNHLIHNLDPHQLLEKIHSHVQKKPPQKPVVKWYLEPFYRKHIGTTALISLVLGMLIFLYNPNTLSGNRRFMNTRFHTAHHYKPLIIHSNDLTANLVKNTQTKDIIASNDELNAIDQQRYSIELKILPNIDEARSFVYQHRLQGYVFYWLHEKNNNSSAAIMYGHYKNKQQALLGLKRLSRSMQKWQPSIRALPIRSHT